MAEGTGLEPARPEGHTRIPTGPLSNSPTLRWRKMEDSNPYALLRTPAFKAGCEPIRGIFPL